MGEPLKSRHVRLSPKADKVLVMLAELEEKDAAELARLLLEEVLLGRVHTLTLLTDRVRRVGLAGTERD